MVELHNIKITANTLRNVPLVSIQRGAVVACTLQGSPCTAERHLSLALSTHCLIVQVCLAEHVTLHSVLCWCQSFIYVFPLSDAFDFQFGAVILRLKEGLDVSHIQGQGIKHMHTYTTWFLRGDKQNIIFICNTKWQMYPKSQTFCWLDQGYLSSEAAWLCFTTASLCSAAFHCMWEWKPECVNGRKTQTLRLAKCMDLLNCGANYH